MNMKFFGIGLFTIFIMALMISLNKKRHQYQDSSNLKNKNYSEKNVISQKENQNNFVRKLKNENNFLLNPTTPSTELKVSLGHKQDRSRQDTPSPQSELKELRARQLKNWLLEVENSTKLNRADYDLFNMSADQTYLELKIDDGSVWQMDSDEEQQIRRIQIRYPNGVLIGKIYFKNQLQQLSYQDKSGKLYYYKIDL